MTSALTNFAIAVAITAAACYALMARVENQRRRRRIDAASGDSGSYSGTDDAFGLASWFSSSHSTTHCALDSSGNPVDGGGWGDAGSDSSCGGDGGGGGGGDGGGGD